MRIHAPFYVRGVWTWITWTAPSDALGSVYGACVAKATAIGATMWDSSQASVMINGTVTQGHPTVFR